MVNEVENEPEAPALETFVPAVDFIGFYPDDFTKVEFKAGVESIPVSPEFASLMREKGLVADK